jgi:ribonuclease HI
LFAITLSSKDNNLNTPVLKIFTDGSCHPHLNIGAWAAILIYGDEKMKIYGESANTNHQRMELTAVIKSIELADENFENSAIELYTDSQYVVRLMDRKDNLIKKKFVTKNGDLLHNSDLLEILIHQIENHTIEFIKVKAHQKQEKLDPKGLQINSTNYNTEVDKLARKIVRESVHSENFLPDS